MALLSALSNTGIKSRLFASPLIEGMASLFIAVPVALVIGFLHLVWEGQAEKAVLATGVLFVSLISIPVAVYLLFRRRAAEPSKVGLIVLATTVVLLLSAFYFQHSFVLLFPADFLVWSESDFINDVLKLRSGYPLFTAEINNESFVYMPGPQLLAAGLVWLTGNDISIPLFRMVQLGYTFLAAVVAFLCCGTLLRLLFPELRYQALFPWGIIWLPLLFLFATNSLTNPFVANLNSDALALLASVTAYYLLLKYIETRDKRLLILMALVPPLGFVAKQSVAIWAALFLVYLAVFDRQRSLARLAVFSLVTLAGFSLVLGSSYLLWGDNFVYWIFTVLGAHGVSPLRSLRNLLDVWPYLAIGLVSALVLLRGARASLLLPAWLVWLALMLVSAYTSGVAWMLNHMGPASLIAGIWFVAAFTKLWTVDLPKISEGMVQQRWIGYAIVLVVVVTLSSGLGFIRIPMEPFSATDADRYVKEIEREFASERAQDVLLDVGSWVYIRDGVIMKDRAPTIGERGYSATGDFSGILQRLREKRYSKILVRNFHSDDFWYDHYLWGQSSGIKAALNENYREIGVIKEVEGKDRYSFSEISVLVPRE